MTEKMDFIKVDDFEFDPNHMMYRFYEPNLTPWIAVERRIGGQWIARWASHQQEYSLHWTVGRKVAQKLEEAYKIYTMSILERL